MLPIHEHILEEVRLALKAKTKKSCKGSTKEPVFCLTSGQREEILKHAKRHGLAAAKLKSSHATKPKAAYEHQLELLLTSWAARLSAVVRAAAKQKKPIAYAELISRAQKLDVFEELSEVVRVTIGKKEFQLPTFSTSRPDAYGAGIHSPRLHSRARPRQPVGLHTTRNG